VYRSLSLDERLAPAALTRGVTVTQMIDIMQDAATVDLRGSRVLPLALAVLEGDVEVVPYTAVLSAWVAAGAHRRAPAPDLPYDHQAAIALIDAWWERLVRAVFDDELAGVYDLIPLPIDDPNRREHVGSAFQEGFYGLVAKALRQALGLPVGAPMSVLSCGGSLDACRSALRDSLLSAVAALEARFGGGPSTWVVSKGDDEIQFQSLGLVTLPPMDWQNRPTFQQVVQVLRRRAGP
jgi:hypothetical protein